MTSTRTDNKSFNLAALKIIPSGSTPLDCMSMMVELSLYEDLFATTLSGELLLNDSNDLFKNLPLMGFDYLELDFSKPGSATTITKTFRIYKVDNQTINTNMSNQTYSLKFCSEEEILSTYLKISKSYPGKLVSDIITDILKNILKVNTTKLGTIDPTTGIQNLVIPNYNPFQAIRWLSQRSLPMSLFFENISGFQFRTIDNLMSQSPKVTYSYAYPNITLPDQPDSLNPQDHVIKYEFVKNFDVISATRNGVYGGKLITIDPILGTHEEIDLDYKDFFGKNKHVESSGSPFINAAQDRFGKTINQYQSTYQVYPTTKSQPNPNQVEQWLLQKNTRMMEMNYSKLKLVVPGSAAVTAGDVIKFIIPSMETHSSKIDNSNPYHSGNFLVTAVRHKINFAHYEMILECVKDCVSKDYPMDGNIQQAVGA
jgi:hypothetical protein